MDSLVEAITELVMQELASGPRPSPQSVKLSVSPSGPRVLVVCGVEAVPSEVWAAFGSTAVTPVGLACGAQWPAEASSWALENRQARQSGWIGDYRGVCLLGADLATLGSLAALGAGGAGPVVTVMAALSAGVPVFCEASSLEQVRRHSARLAPGLTKAFEDAWKTVGSFGVQFGQQAELCAFLSALGEGKAATSSAAKTQGRDVVTTEDVEAVRQAGRTTLSVGMGAIVTPLARQQATEWGIEVKFL